MTLLRPYRRHLGLIVFAILMMPMAMHLLPSMPIAGDYAGDPPWEGASARAGGRQSGLTYILRRLDAEIESRFGGRSLMILAYSRLRYAIRSPISRSVTYGQDGWLFFTVGRMIEQVSGDRVRPDAVESLVTVLRDMDARLDAEGGTLVSAIAPNKHSVHAEKLPRWAQRRLGANDYDLFLNGMQAAGLTTVDLRVPLRSAAMRSPVYLSTDTHWNRLGALVAFDSIVAAGDLPEWQMTREAALGELEPVAGGDLARLLGVGGILGDVDHDLRLADPSARILEFGDYFQRSYEVAGDGDAGTLLVVGDSFSRNLLLPYFVKSATRVVWTHHKNCKFDWDLVRKYQPRYVFFIVVERSMSTCTGNRPENF